MSDPTIHPDNLQFAAQVAHQLRAPVAAVKMMLRMLLGDFAGPLTPRQRDLILKANERCDQSLESVSRMLAIASAVAGDVGATAVGDVAALAREVIGASQGQASAARITLAGDLGDEPVLVRIHGHGFQEAIAALLDNALKYTPEQGQVRVRLVVDRENQQAALTVSDSGVGISEDDRVRVFMPFVRGSTVRKSAYPGTGLGLAFVKAVADAAGGSASADTSDLGGAALTLRLPLAPIAEAKPEDDSKEGRPMRVVIVGGVAAGPKAAAKIIRLLPDAEVTVVEKGQLLSYAGCGLPYYVSGVIEDPKELMSTPAGVVRDAVFFQQFKSVRVMNQTEAVAIDRENRRLKVRDLVDQKEAWLEYDKLVLATGASPIVPPVPNVDLKNIFTLHGVRDAEGLKAVLSARKARDVVIVGAGLIGVEFTESLVKIGCRVTLVEKQPQILGLLDWDMAKLVELHMESHGVKVLTGTTVESFEGDQAVSGVVTDQGTLPADLVVLAGGVRPNVQLAIDAGLKIGPTGGIQVDPTMRTSDDDVYAAGDCVESVDLITGQPCYVPLGSTANKQGRVAAVNIAGGKSQFPGVLGTTVCRVFDYCVARTGLSEEEARRHGYDVVTVSAPAPDKEHFVPDAAMLLLKLVADRKTRRVLGAQGTGPGAADKRIDVAAMAITAKMTVDQLANADLCYAPPYSPAMDNLITAANVAANKLDGHMRGISAAEVNSMLARGEDFLFLDVRTPAEHQRVRLPKAKLVPLGTLRGRMDEIAKATRIVVFCNISLRAYEAALILRASGHTDCLVLDGGVEMWPFEKHA
jgi:NADPH-dependent 2,4-dienoyl-CoA reductase/sulfur reductase-like enzyme/rhodanese-related sulfurtransferase